MNIRKQLALAVTALCVFVVFALVGSAPPDTEMRSMIVQGRDVATVKSAVAAVGGEITHELGIIRAVGARLTAAQVNTLRDLDGIRRVYENRGIGIAEAGDAISITVADDFESASWTNNGGPDDWAQPWQETDPQSGGAGPGAGQVQITGGGLRLDDTPDTGGFPSAARRVDLSGANVAFLSFDFHTTAGLDTSDAIAVEVSRGDPACATCAPNAMNVILRKSGNVKVDHMGDTLHVNATRGNIRGHQDLIFPVLESIQCALTLALGAARV